MQKAIIEKPPLAPLESSEEEEEQLLTRKAKKKRQMAQSAKVKLCPSSFKFQIGRAHV